MVADIQERINPGCIVPAGQCPNCGALAYLEKPPLWSAQFQADNFDAMKTKLAELVAIADNINARQHAGNPIDPDLWSELYAESKRAHALLATLEKPPAPATQGVSA